MAEIPKYQSRRTVTGRVPRPNMPDYTVQIGQKVTKVFSKVADEFAEKDGLERGYNDVYQNNVKIKDAEAKGDQFSISGRAYTKGSRSAYIAKTNTEFENEMTKLYANTELNANTEAFSKEANKVKDRFAKEMTTELQSIYLPELEKKIAGYNNNVTVNEVRLNDEKNTQIVFDRINNVLLPRINEQILLGNSSESDFAEILAIQEDLFKRNKISASDFSKNTKALLSSLVVPYFKNKMATAENPAEFVDAVTDRENTEGIMQEIYRVYGDEYEKVIGEGTFPSTLNDSEHKDVLLTLERELSKQTTRLKTERVSWQNGVTNKIETAIKNGDRLASVLDPIDFSAEMDRLLYDDEEKEAMYAIWKEGAIITQYTRNLSTTNIKGIENRISELDTALAELETLDQTDANTNIKRSAYNKAKEYLIAKQGELLTNYKEGKIYAYLKVNETETEDDVISELNQKSVFEMTEDDLLKRREIAADFLGLDNTEEMPLLDDSEISLLKDGLTGATNANQLKDQITYINSLDLPSSIYLEMDLPGELESLFILGAPDGDSTAFTFAAQSYLEKDTNLRAAGITKKDSETAARDFFDTDDKYEGIGADPDVKVAMIDVYSSYYAKALAQTGDETQANKIAKNYFEKVFRVEEVEWNGQNVMIPNSVSTTKFRQTLVDAEDILNNPVKYGIILDGNVGVNEFDLAANTIIVRDGDKLLFAIENNNNIRGNEDGNLTYYQVQHTGSDGKATTSVLSLNIDPDKRQKAPNSTDANPLWNIKVDSTEAPLLTDENTQTWEKHYFDIAVKGGYGIDKVEPFATNIEPNDRDKQVILTGIAVRLNDQTTFSDDEFKWLSTNYPEIFEGLAIKEVQEEVAFLFAANREFGGYKTLRTGKKLSPLATLYVIHQDSYVDYLQDEIEKLKKTTGKAENIFDADPNKEGTQFFNLNPNNTDANKLKALEKKLAEEQ
jgi:hypothetical protein